MNNRRTHTTREQRNRIKLIIRSFVVGAAVAFGIWVFLSWMDIAFHNCYPNPVYKAWNLFAMDFPF